MLIYLKWWIKTSLNRDISKSNSLCPKMLPRSRHVQKRVGCFQKDTYCRYGLNRHQKSKHWWLILILFWLGNTPFLRVIYPIVCWFYPLIFVGNIMVAEEFLYVHILLMKKKQFLNVFAVRSLDMFVDGLIFVCNFAGTGGFCPQGVSFSCFPYIVTQK